MDRDKVSDEAMALMQRAASELLQQPRLRYEQRPDGSVDVYALGVAEHITIDISLAPIVNDSSH